MKSLRLRSLFFLTILLGLAVAALSQDGAKPPQPPGKHEVRASEIHSIPIVKDWPDTLHMTRAQTRQYSAFMNRMVARVNGLPANADAATRRRAANIGAAEASFMRKTLTKRQYRVYRIEQAKQRRQIQKNIRLLKNHHMGRK